MCIKTNPPSMVLKEYLTLKDYEEIKELMELCYTNDPVNLKLELDYKLTAAIKQIGARMKSTNEFLYYADGKLVSYLGICTFGGNLLELNGMTHPDYQKKGLFQKLITLAVQEARNNGHKSLLLLSDEKSESGNHFIKKIGGKYKTSEFRMELFDKQKVYDNSPYSDLSITLRQADKTDLMEIARQNAVYFNSTQESEASILDESMLHDGMYMIILKDTIIGKIFVEYDENSAFIYGFGILPEHRKKGYGRASLQTLLTIIKRKKPNEILLDVESKNRNALNLYKSLGFKEMSVMNYYEYMI